jgi:pimeloyl-ACP methyl ester carboxylesterase
MCALFAATYPERTSALILYNAWPRLPGTPDEHRSLMREGRETYGRREALERNVREQYPSLAGDEAFLDALTTIVRATASPGGAAEYFRAMAAADVTDVLPTIRVPTLLLYRSNLPAELDHLPARHPAEHAHQMAAMIPHARAVALPGRPSSAQQSTQRQPGTAPGATD